MRKKEDFPWILNKLEWEETGCFVERRYKRVEIRDLKAETFEGPKSSVLLLSGRYYSPVYKVPLCVLSSSLSGEITKGRRQECDREGIAVIVLHCNVIVIKIVEQMNKIIYEKGKNKRPLNKNNEKPRKRCNKAFVVYFLKYK